MRPASDNAAEGCGRELFGAVVNAHQAQNAANPQLAAAFAGIAGDEHEHARFSFALARDLSPKLTVVQRRRAREAQELALMRLAEGDAPAAREELGLMDEGQTRSTIDALLESSSLKTQ
jgi:hypothetical protein